MVGGDSANNLPIEFSIGEWGAGDDELVALGVLGNDKVDEAEGGLSDEQQSCPVCGIDLTGILVLVGVPD